jgi:serine/threonine protein kinase/tetratricopeptide (TPR) repeat protein/class 3 adenylate cyclase
MNPDRWKKIDQLLEALLELDSSNQPAFIDKTCGDDSDLRKELESLLSAHNKSQVFINTLRADAAAELFNDLKSVDLLGKSIAHYRVLSSLGVGGMGEVYLASDTRLGRPVALKLLAGHFTKDSVKIKRFQQEASAASALNHPGILTVYEIGQHEDLHFIATEFVEGETLRQRIMRGPVNRFEAVEIASQISGALATAHAAGILHRDIKPENIMIRPDGLVKILDFGIAKLSQNLRSQGEKKSTVPSVHTETGAILGTIQYMSPEQLRAFELDQRSDIFSLGIVFYEMLAGKRPFVASTATDEMVSILEKEPLPIDAPPELIRIIRKSLEKNREQRYQTAEEFQTDLKNLIRRLEAESREMLICPSCSRESASTFAFCTTCGTALKKECPNCHSSVPAKDEYCGRCGHQFPITTEGQRTRSRTAINAGIGGERRRATIVYSILSGCSGILEHLDPESADREIGAMRAGAAEVIARHGGVVERCSSEELVALFGVPASYEDDFQRAVQAAIDLHSLRRKLSVDLEKRLGQPITTYTGISTGPVVARLKEDHTHTVSGDALRLASRLAAHAEADEILVSSETQRLIQPFFKLQPRGKVSVKSTGESIEVFRVEGETGVHTRLEAAEMIGLTRYVGRAKQLQSLQASLSGLLAGEGQFVAVMGDAGVGKSRLVLEFLDALDKQQINIIQSRCQTHASNTPYLPFIDTLREVLGLAKEEAGEMRVSAISNIKAIDPSLEAYIPIYLHLLSIENIDASSKSDLKGDDLNLAIQEALSAILTLYAGSKPAIILLEDWQWADEASEEALKRLARLLAVHPLMIIITSRPETSFDWSYVENHTVLTLAPLSENSSIEIMKTIIGSDKLPVELCDLLYKRTGGNPFFIEEVCRSLVDDRAVKVADGVATLEGSIEDLVLPDTVQSLIRTRLDRLDPEAQSLLRHAAVLGREFNLAILERMTGDDALAQLLDRLQKQGLIQQIRVLPEALYRFKHVLTQEVVYDSLLRHHSKALHEAAGVAIEELYSGRLDEQLELLTFHYSRAENWQKAVRFGLESGEKASRLSRFAEALSVLEQTEEWSAKLDQTSESRDVLVQILLSQERQCEVLGLRERQQDLIDRAFAVLSDNKHQALLAETLVRQGELCTLQRCFDKAETALEQALAIRREQTDPIGERTVLRNMGFLFWSQGRYDEAVACNKKALSIDLANDDSDGYAKDLTSLSSILRSEGKTSEALEQIEEALKVNEGLRKPFSTAYTFNVAATVYRDLGDSERAKSLYQKGIELTAQNGLWLHQIIISMALASLCWERGETDESLRLSNELVELTRRLNLRRELAQGLAVLSQRLLEQDRLSEALPHLREAAEIFAQLDEKEEEIRTLTSIAYVYERCGLDPDAALSAWEMVEALWTDQGNIAGELEALEGKARVARNQKHDQAAALEYFISALDAAERLGDKSKQGDLLNTIGILEWSQLNYSSALLYYQRALEIFRTLGDIVHQGLMLNSIGVTMHKLGRGEEAAEQLEDALKLHRRSGQRLLEGHALAALGDVFEADATLGQAHDYYAESLAIRQEIGDRKGEGWMSHHLARVLFSQGEKEQGLRLLNAAAAIAAETDDRDLDAGCARLQP